MERDVEMEDVGMVVVEKNKNKNRQEVVGMVDAEVENVAVMRRKHTGQDIVMDAVE